MVDKLNIDATVASWIAGFRARLDNVMRLTPPESNINVTALSDQYMKVVHCQESALNTNGKTVNNLRTASERLNTMLCEAEETLRQIL